MKLREESTRLGKNWRVYGSREMRLGKLEGICASSRADRLRCSDKASLMKIGP
jgi:hypothetical protein